jgi:predicted metal-dependent enzyme (double-stranded beta helix superfamily)
MGFQEKLTRKRLDIPSRLRHVGATARAAKLIDVDPVLRRLAGREDRLPEPVSRRDDERWRRVLLAIDSRLRVAKKRLAR